MTWAVIGVADLAATGSVDVLLEHDWTGTTSSALAPGDRLPPDALRFDVYDEAAAMANRLKDADARLWPPFVPILAEVSDADDAAIACWVVPDGASEAELPWLWEASRTFGVPIRHR